MAKKRTEAQDIYDPKIFDPLGANAKKNEAEVDLLVQSMQMLVELGKQIKTGLSTTNPQSVAGLKQMNDLMSQANKAADAKIKLDKQLKAATDDQVKGRLKLQKVQQDQRKILKDEIILQDKSIGTLERARVENRKLRREREALNLETSKGQQRLKGINKTIDKNNKIIEDNADKMKKQRLGIGRYHTAVNGLKNALAQLGIAFGVFSLAKDAIKVIGDFQQSTANLRSVLRDASDQEMEAMINQAKELGATTRFTASQVAELQLEFGKLGFDPTEILNMTKATQNLAAATGTELKEAASTTGGVLNAFGLESSDTAHLVDVMAASFTKSALDMEKFRETMKSAAPIAKATGVSLEIATAAAGKLADANISGSKAGTDLKNIFSALVKDGKPFAQSLEDIAAQMNNASTKAEKLQIAEDIVGEKAKASLLVLIEQKDALGELSGELERAGGTAEAMAKDQLDTLQGSLDLLRSAWEGVILEMDEAGGIGDSLKTGIKLLADNLSTIVKVIASAIKIWVQYKFVTLASAQANKLMGSSMIRLAKQVGPMKAGIAGIGKAWKNLGKTLKANAFGLALLAIMKFVEGLNVVRTASEQMLEVQEKVNAAHADAQVQLERETTELNLLVDQIKDTTNGTKERTDAIDKLNKKYNTNLQNIEDETKFLKLLDIEQKKILKNIENKIALMEVEQEFAIFSEQIVRTELEQTKLRQQMADAWGQNAFTEFIQGFGDYENTKSVLAEQFRQNEQLLKDLAKKKGIAKKDLAELLKLQAESQAASAQSGTGTGDGDPESTLRTVQAINDDISAENEKLLQTTNRAQARAIQNRIKALEREKKAILGSKGKEADKIKSLLREIEDEQIKQIKDQQTREEITASVAASRRKEDLKDVKASAEEKAKLEIEINQTLVIKLAEIRKRFRDQRIAEEKVAAEKRAEQERKIAETVQEAYDAELEQLNQAFERSEKQKQKELLESTKTQEEIQRELLEFEIAQLEKKIELYKKLYPELTDEILDFEIELAEKRRDLKETETKTELDADKEKFERQKELIQATTDLFVENADKRIAKIDEEIAASQRLADFLAGAAAEGNISAKESLAEERRLIAEANAEKERLERQKQNVLLVSAILQAYNAELSQGASSTEAFTKAVTSTTLLKTFLGEIGSFYEGTENTGRVSNPLDGNGGRLALIHDDERIMTANQNRKVGDISNNELANIAEKHRLGKFDPGFDVQIGQGYDSQIIVDQLMSVGDGIDQVAKEIREKPELSLAKLQRYNMILKERSKRGNRSTNNIFKIRY